MFGTLQDRLIKELAQLGIGDIRHRSRRQQDVDHAVAEQVEAESGCAGKHNLTKPRRDHAAVFDARRNHCHQASIGRRELAQLQPFDLIFLVVIGDLIQQGVTQNDLSVTGLILVVSTIGLLQVCSSYLSFRFRRLRPVLNGEPVVIIENGRFIERNLKRERLTPDDVAEEMRQNQIHSLDEIQWAVLETSGKMSFLKKPSSS